MLTELMAEHTRHAMNMNAIFAKYSSEMQEEPEKSPEKAPGKKRKMSPIKKDAGKKRSKKNPYINGLKARTAFNLFSSDTRKSLKMKELGFGDVSREVSKLWKAITKEDKDKYQKLADAEKVQKVKDSKKTLEEVSKKLTAEMAKEQPNEDEIKNLNEAITILTHTVNGTGKKRRRPSMVASQGDEPKAKKAKKSEPSPKNPKSKEIESLTSPAESKTSSKKKKKKKKSKKNKKKRESAP